MRQSCIYSRYKSTHFVVVFNVSRITAYCFIRCLAVLYLRIFFDSVKKTTDIVLKK